MLHDYVHLFPLNTKLTELLLDKARLIVPLKIISLLTVSACHDFKCKNLAVHHIIWMEKKTPMFSTMCCKGIYSNILYRFLSSFHLHAVSYKAIDSQDIDILHIQIFHQAKGNYIYISIYRISRGMSQLFPLSLLVVVWEWDVSAY